MPGATSTLTSPDYAVVAVALAALLIIGVVLIRRQQDTTDFFLARRRVPWWAASLSFLATEISAVTLLALPATAYGENWQYVQLFVAASLAKLVVAFLFIPAFYRHDVTTIYELLAHRFGRRSQVTASIVFFLTRVAGSGVRLTITALAVGHLTGVSLVPTIAVFSVVSILYIAAGGVQAVVWTNVVQTLTFLAAGAVALAFLIAHVDGGLLAIISTAGAAGRLAVVDWGPPITAPGFWASALTNPDLVWVALLTGFVGSMAAFGTDHDLMQRLLTVETRGQSQRSLALTPLGILLTLLIYLSLGAALFTYYSRGPVPILPRPDAIMPHFVATAMPEVLRGLMLAAIVLASIDAPLGSLSASFVTDIYRPLLRPGRSEQHYLRVSRAAVLAFGVVLAAVAWGCAFMPDQALWRVFKVVGVASGSLLGVFLLALTRRTVDDTASVVAMLAMTAIDLLLLVFSESGVLQLAWSWLVLVGALGTMLLAVLGSQLVTRR